MAFQKSTVQLVQNYRTLDPGRKTRYAALVVFVLAGTVRLFYAAWNVVDFWGDAYHHWLISRLTLSNNWVYTDYKGLETVWLPGYHYLTAALMSFWGRFDLTPAHLTNLLLGSLACGLLTWLVAQIARDWRVGLGAGVTLALLPWHIAYSYINMPEVMAGVLLLLTLIAARRGLAVWIAVLAFAGTLTRHELTLLMVPVGLWLVWRREWRAASGLALGSMLGLGVWSAWSYQVIGDPLHWWNHYRTLTAWDAQFWAESGTRLADAQTLWEAARRAFPPLLVVALVALAALIFRPWRRQVPLAGWLLLALVLLHWLALSLGFVAGNLPSPDPRYVLVSLPLVAGAGVILIAALPQKWLRRAVSVVYALFLVFSLFRHLPDFRDMAYILAPERGAGEFLGRVAPEEGNFWVDAPVAIYFSQVDPARFRSSEQLLPEPVREQDDVDCVALEAITTQDIRFVLWEDVPYTYVQRVFPQMAYGSRLEQNGLRFEPVFQYAGWELEYGARPTLLWRIVPVSRAE
jgi:hypothetical protein